MKRWIGIIVTAALLGGGLYLWSIWPMTTVMSAKWVKWRLDSSVPRIETTDAWQERGKYVVTVAGCGMCHTPYSWIGPHQWLAFQGGMRVRWNNALGERVALNLTPDPETGIGRWSENEFIVAMKTGMYPDGRVAHWQAMPWDMHSNWSLDDMRAIYRYLMALPPKPAPKNKPIDDALPEADTFYFGT